MTKIKQKQTETENLNNISNDAFNIISDMSNTRLSYTFDKALNFFIKNLALNVIFKEIKEISNINDINMDTLKELNKIIDTDYKKGYNYYFNYSYKFSQINSKQYDGLMVMVLI